MIVWLSSNGRKQCSPETGTYCEARQRTPVSVIKDPAHQTASKIDDNGSVDWPWKVRSVDIFDGSTVSMPDTHANQSVHPQSKTQGIGLGFPSARIVAFISLATGVLRDLAIGPYKGKNTGETALFRTLIDGLKEGEVLLGDRLFHYFSASQNYFLEMLISYLGCIEDANLISDEVRAWGFTIIS
jgi:hypothetical protein